MDMNSAEHTNKERTMTTRKARLNIIKTKNMGTIYTVTFLAHNGLVWQVADVAAVPTKDAGEEIVAEYNAMFSS